MAGRLRIAAVLAVLAAACFAQPASAAPGDLDTSWDTDGKLNDDDILGPNGVAIQSDGKVVVVSPGSQNLSVIRYNTDGSRDTSFSGDGRNDLDAGGNETGRALVIQPDGKIVVVGDTNLNQGDFVIARFNSDGSPDTSFGGGDGFETTDIGTNTSDGARGVALQSDGRIVVAGGSENDFAVVRYTSTGALDTAGFGAGTGKVTTDLGSNFDTVAGVGVQSGGRIVVGGYTVIGGDFDFAVAGYTSAGVLDSSYGAAGIRTANIAFDQAFGFAMQSDGKAVLSGHTDNDRFTLMRFDATGTLDTGFDGDGKVETTFASSAFQESHAVTVQQNGRIVAVGIVDIGGCCDFAIARYEPDGTLDSSFGTGGKVTTSFVDGEDDAKAVAVNPSNGRIVVAGGRSSGSCECSLGAIAAYLGDPPPPPPQEPPPEQPPPEQPPPQQPPPDACANDKTGPTVTITSNQKQTLYQQRESPASVTIAASDASGLANNPSDSNRPITTKTVGVQTVTVTARDRCNNETTRTFRYRVAGDPEIGIAGVRATCTTSSFLMRVTIDSDVSLRSLVVRLDGRVIAQGNGRRLTVKIPTKRLSEGRHVLTVTARDRAGNRVTERANFARCVTVVPHFTG